MENKLLLALKCTLNSYSNSHYLCSNCPFGYGIPLEDGTKDPPYICNDLRIFDDVYKYMAANA